jgi:hypothetical protein
MCVYACASSWSKYSPFFTDLGGSLTCSREAATDPWNEPDESNPSWYRIYFKILANIFLPITSRLSKRYHPFRFSNRNSIRTPIYSCVVMCTAVAMQRPRARWIYKSVSGQRLGKYVPAAMGISATIVDLCFLCGPVRIVISKGRN